MTKSEMFKEAHRRAADDFASNPELPEVMRKPYAHYFRLQLLSLQRAEREARTGLCTGFQVVEPWYKRNQYNPRTGQWVAL